MIQSAPQGATIELDAEFRDGTGHLVDPATPKISISQPSGTVVVNLATPAKIAVGLYRYSLSLDVAAVTGLWKATWSATVTGTPLTFDDPFLVSAYGTPPVSESAGVEHWEQGQTAVLDLESRSASGLLADLDSVTVTILDTTGASRASSASPQHLATGVYRYLYTVPVDATVGIWRAQWDVVQDGNPLISVDAFEIVGVGAGALHVYGASLDGMRAFVPYLGFGSAGMPGDDEANAYLDAIGSEVSLRLGNFAGLITDVGLLDRVMKFARYVVELGAAATAALAAFPANEVPNQSGYGTSLWERYQVALAELIGLVNDATPGPDPGSGLTSGAAVSAPPPVLTTFMQF